MKVRLTLLEIFLLQTIVWLGLWLLNDYIAALLTLIVGAIVSAVLIIALISEAIERSKVPKKYFWVMAISLGCMLLATLIYVGLLGGKLEFLTK